MKIYDPKKWHPTGINGIRFRYHKTRKNGTQPDRYWAIYYRLEGKQKEEGVGWASHGFSKDEAQNLLGKLKSNHRTGRGPQTLKEMRDIEHQQRKQEEEKAVQEEKANITFNEFFDTIYMPLQKTNTKPESWRKNESHGKVWLKPELGGLPIKQIKEENLENLKKKMIDQGKSPRLIQYVFSTFKQAWTLAKNREIVSGAIPCKEVKLPKFDNQSLRFFLKEEAEALLEKIKSKSEIWYQMCLISLHTGMRIGEVWNLTWRDVNLETKIGTARDTKSAGRTRHIYFTEETVSVLKSLFENQRLDDFIFKNTKGEKITQVSRSVYLAIDDLGFNAGVTDKKFRASCHTFRHTYASWLAQSGRITLHQLKELLGHRTIQQTERYAKLMPQGIQSAASEFEKIIS